MKVMGHPRVFVSFSRDLNSRVFSYSIIKAMAHNIDMIVNGKDGSWNSLFIF